MVNNGTILNQSKSDINLFSRMTWFYFGYASYMRICTDICIYACVGMWHVKGCKYTYIFKRADKIFYLWNKFGYIINLHFPLYMRFQEQFSFNVNLIFYVYWTYYANNNYIFTSTEQIYYEIVSDKYYLKS